MNTPENRIQPERSWRFGEMERPLEKYDGARPPSPDWFREALAMPVEQRTIEVDGCPIETLSYGDRHAPGLLLVHGTLAHAHWWSPVAQLLARDFRVTSFSFSGMGGSGWRDTYSVRGMAREVWGVAQQCGLLDNGRRPIIAAHSFGGRAAAILSGEQAGHLGGVIFVDCLIMPEKEAGAPKPQYKRSYDSEAAALKRFRLWPDQPGLDYVIDEIARAGIMPRDGGWTWRFDPDFIMKMQFATGWEEVTHSPVPLAFLRGANTDVVHDEDWAMQKSAMPPGTIFLEIPEAHHHIMMDQPIALATAIGALAAAWNSRR